MIHAKLDMLKHCMEFIYAPYSLREIDFKHKINVVIVKEFGHFYKGVPVITEYLGSIHTVSEASIALKSYREWPLSLQIDKKRCFRMGISRREAEIRTNLH